MLDFIKFVINCFIQMFDFMANNVDKAPHEHQSATYGVIGAGIFTVCFLLFLLKVIPKDWSFFKAVIVSSTPSLLLTIVYFMILYFVIR